MEEQQESPAPGVASIDSIAPKKESSLKALVETFQAGENVIPARLMHFLLDHVECLAKLEEALECPTMKDLNRWQADWAKTVACNDAIERGLKDAGVALMKHITAITSEKLRAESKKKRDADEAALKENAAKLQQNVEKIKRAKEQAAHEILALFQVQIEVRQPFTLVAAKVWEPGSLSVSEPALLAPGDDITTCLAERVLGKRLAQFGSTYKKKQGFDSSGKVIEKLEKGAGLEQAQAFFLDLVKGFSTSTLLDVSSVAKHFSQSNWLFGYRGGYNTVATTPNSCAMMMALVVGKTEHFFFEASSTVKALQALNLPKSNITEMTKSLGDLNAAGLRSLLDKGAHVKCCMQTSEEVVYCPTGYIHVFRSLDGPVTYGMRKSFFFQGDEQGQSGYIMLRELQAAAKADVSKMEQIEGLFST